MWNLPSSLYWQGMEHVLEFICTEMFHLRIQETHRTDRVVLIASLVLELSPIFYKSQGTLKVDIFYTTIKRNRVTGPVPGEWCVLCMAGLPDKHRHASQGMDFTDPYFPSSVEWVGFLEAPLPVPARPCLSWFPGWCLVAWPPILHQNSGPVFFPLMPMSVNHL